MASKNKQTLDEKLQLLRIAANSSAVTQASIVVDASRYIMELKDKVDQLNRDIAMSETDSGHNSLPTVEVERLHKGFLINVFSDRNCPGLLGSILEAFDELGLDVLDAKASCSDKFHLEAVGENEEEPDSIDQQVVKEAVVRAIRNWSDDRDEDE